MKEKTKEELLDEAREKPVRKFIQYDIFFDVGSFDPIVRPDKDGDSVFRGRTFELNRSNTLRVFVPENSHPDDVVRGLNKVIDWIERDVRQITEDYFNFEYDSPF